MVATVVLSVGFGAGVHADEPVGERPADTGDAIVAVGAAPVPVPITVAVGASPVPLPITVAVGRPPVAPAAVDVSVGEPPVPLARAAAPAGSPEPADTGQVAGQIAGVIVEAAATVQAARALIDRRL